MFYGKLEEQITSLCNCPIFWIRSRHYHLNDQVVWARQFGEWCIFDSDLWPCIDGRDLHAVPKNANVKTNMRHTDCRLLQL